MYLLTKTLHVLAVVLFLGNIITGLFWHQHALRTGDPRLIAHTVDGLIRSDRLFTNPGVILIIATGVYAAVQGDWPILGTGWILWTIVLFVIAGAVFGLRIAPLQRAMRDHAAAGAQAGNFDLAGYRALALRWERWGAVAVGAPLAGLALMVLKPVL